MGKDLKFRITLQNLLKGGLDAATRQIRGFQQSVERVASGVRSAMGRISGALLSVKTVIAGAGIAVAFRALGETIKQAFKVETALTQFKVLTGSMQKAKQVFKDLKEFSDATPFEFGEVAQAGRMLLAFGTTAENLLPTLTRIGDVASAVGMSFVELAEIYGKNQVQGRLMAQDINQMTGRGIPIIQELAKQFGVSEGEVRGLVEEGKVGFSAMEKAFVSLTSEGGKFYGMMKEMSATGDGLFSTLKGEWIGALADFGAEFMGLAKDGIQGAIDRLKKLREDGTISAWAKEAADRIKLVKDAMLSIGDGDTTTLKLSFNVLKEGAKSAFMIAVNYLIDAAPRIGKLIGAGARYAMDTAMPLTSKELREAEKQLGGPDRGAFGYGVFSMGTGDIPQAVKDRARQNREDQINREVGIPSTGAPIADMAKGFTDAVGQLRTYLDSKAPKYGTIPLPDESGSGGGGSGGFVPPAPAGEGSRKARARASGSYLESVRSAIQSSTYAGGPKMAMSESAQRFRSQMSKSALPGSVGLSGKTEIASKQEFLQSQTLKSVNETNDILRKGLLGD